MQMSIINNNQTSLLNSVREAILEWDTNKLKKHFLSVAENFFGPRRSNAKDVYEALFRKCKNAYKEGSKWGALYEGSRWFYHTYQDLACELKMGVRTVKRWVRWLREEEWIIVKHFRKHAGDHTNFYAINFAKIGANITPTQGGAECHLGTVFKKIQEYTSNINNNIFSDQRKKYSANYKDLAKGLVRTIAYKCGLSTLAVPTETTHTPPPAPIKLPSVMDMPQPRTPAASAVKTIVFDESSELDMVLKQFGENMRP